MKHHRSLLLLSIWMCPSLALAQDAPVDDTSDDAAPETDEVAPEEGAPDGDVDIAFDVDPDAEQGTAEAEEVVETETTTTEGAADAAEADMAAESETLDRPSLAEDLGDAAQETDDEADDEEEDEGSQVPWRGSILTWDHEVTTATFDPSATLTHNPTYNMYFSLRPRWHFTDELWLRLRQDLAIELTDTDTRTRNREPVLADTILDLGHSKLLEVAGMTIGGRARLTLPTSIASRAYQKYFGLGGAGSVSYPIENVLEGLQLGTSVGWSYSFAGSNVPLADDDFPQAYAIGPRAGLSGVGAGEPAQAGPATVIGHAVTFDLSASLAIIEGLSVDAYFLWWWRQGRGLADAEVPVASAPGGVVTLGDDSSHLRLLTWFTLGVGYDVTDWVNASLTYGVLTGEFNPDASRRNPFWNVDSTVALTATVKLDEVYETFIAAPDPQEQEPQVARTSRGHGRTAQ